MHVAWVETRGGGRLLRVARWSGSERIPLGSAVNFDPTRGVRCPRLAVEGEGKLVLSRSEDDAAGVPQLWLARWDGSTWIDLPGPLDTEPSVLVYDAQMAGQPGYLPAVSRGAARRPIPPAEPACGPS